MVCPSLELPASVSKVRLSNYFQWAVIHKWAEMISLEDCTSCEGCNSWGTDILLSGHRHNLTARELPSVTFSCLGYGSVR